MNVHEIEEYLIILKYTLVQPHFNILHLPHFFWDLSSQIPMFTKPVRYGTGRNLLEPFFHKYVWKEEFFRSRFWKHPGAKEASQLKTTRTWSYKVFYLRYLWTDRTCYWFSNGRYLCGDKQGAIATLLSGHIHPIHHEGEWQNLAQWLSYMVSDTFTNCAFVAGASVAGAGHAAHTEHDGREEGKREVGLVDERLVQETLAILTLWILCWRWGPCCPGRTQLLWGWPSGELAVLTAIVFALAARRAQPTEALGTKVLSAPMQQFQKPHRWWCHSGWWEAGAGGSWWSLYS